MKSRGKKLLSTLLVIVMVFSTSALYVLAADAPVSNEKEPQLYASTENSIILKAEAGHKYAVQIDKEEDKVWQWASAEQYNPEDHTVSFTGLKADTSYTFASMADDGDEVLPQNIQSYKTKSLIEEETKETQIIDNNNAKNDAPSTPQAGKPSLPEVESRTDTKIRFQLPGDLDAKFAEGYEIYFSKDKGVNFDLLSAPYEVTGLDEDTEYIYYALIAAGTYDGTAYLQSDSTDHANVKTLKSAAAAPEAPTVSSRTETTITLAAKDNQEFAIVQGNMAGQWQVSPEFTGLTPNTEYKFITRFVFDSDEAMESKASEAVTTKTVIPFTGSTITGITPNASYTPGTSLTAAAAGNGMENTHPVKNDTRWVPDSWYWNSKKVSKWDKEPYSIPFTLKTAGNYKLTVNFRLEEYDGSAWTSLNKTEASSVEFKVTAPTVEKYNITASSGTGGKISPSGTVSVEKGQNSTFTFTSDKNYKVSKVYIDGKETKVKNNNYTFENVSSDHKISVTFEKTSKLTAAKTGDNSMLPLWILAGISGCCIVVLIVRRRYSKKNL
ncbi:hypothetical protein NE683_11020 [Bariatricus massiliensis]|uniref:Uncharacterized protein n=1 Tax=Bariatricus massiliensis TaxID=1745713 RepID=A0ABS8DH25_9FIRM|nr:hypothetical protein [Bariatricus massiliensis]MCB7304359.1 hypothetical protein [Bariatricus massiliensis]MCB7375010.1 hypothetical protein [Bariatricus massiliensis]MCB7387469.1 hypothetical protein [Bariatricus massiliensis]MCB7411631.1 hypothetical protein [Bariatricus massiliensis]MCQ5253766.1 hypothetical protein [Bariatricus massiliensis]